MRMTVRRTSNFPITGAGTHRAWAKTEWVSLSRWLKGGAQYSTSAKVLYSATGLYFLVDSEDRRVTSTGLKDFDHLYREDVVEVFLWPLESQMVYFEYEISPLGAELPVLVSKHGKNFYGWLPWDYEKDRRVTKATSVRGGAKKPGAKIDGWTAEFFIPFALLKGLGNIPPVSGTRWRANVYRIDYDRRPIQSWAWSPVEGRAFHDLKRFGTLIFE